MVDDADYMDICQILAKLFLSEPGKTALAWLEKKYDAAPVFENSNREYFNHGRRAVIKEISNMANHYNN